MRKQEQLPKAATTLQRNVKDVLALLKKGMTTSQIHEATGIDMALVSSIKTAAKDAELLRALPCGTAPVLAKKHTKIIAMAQCGHDVERITSALDSSKAHVKFTIKLFDAVKQAA